MADVIKDDGSGAEAIRFAEFLKDVPPLVERAVFDLGWSADNQSYGHLAQPEIALPCTTCGNISFFRAIGDRHHAIPDPRHGYKDLFVGYRCTKCGTDEKLFALRVTLKFRSQSGLCLKIGEMPGFSPPTPPRLVSLIGPARDYFFLARRSE